MCTSSSLGHLPVTEVLGVVWTLSEYCSRITSALHANVSNHWCQMPTEYMRTILKLFAGKDQPLLVWRDSLFVLNFCLDVVNSIGRLHLQSDCCRFKVSSDEEESAEL